MQADLENAEERADVNEQVFLSITIVMMTTNAWPLFLHVDNKAYIDKNNLRLTVL